MKRHGIGIGISWHFPKSLCGSVWFTVYYLLSSSEVIVWVTVGICLGHLGENVVMVTNTVFRAIGFVRD